MSASCVDLSLRCLLGERGPARACPLLLCVACVCNIFLRQLWRQERVEVNGLVLVAVVKGLRWWLNRLAGVGAAGSCCRKGLVAVAASVK